MSFIIELRENDSQHHEVSISDGFHYKTLIQLLVSFISWSDSSLRFINFIFFGRRHHHHRRKQEKMLWWWLFSISSGEITWQHTHFFIWWPFPFLLQWFWKIWYNWMSKGNHKNNINNYNSKKDQKNIYKKNIIWKESAVE